MQRTLSWALLVFLFYPWQLSAQAPQAWVVSSLDRVGPTDAAGSGLQADISAARGEYESFQIIVRGPESGLSNVNIEISDLSGPNGAFIPKTAFTLYREHYVQVVRTSPDWQGSNRPKPAGWYPDALIPFNNPATGEPLSGAVYDAVPFNLSWGWNQPIWVDVLVPRDAPAGQYWGTFTVTSDQGQTTGQVSLRVWNFTLPLKPSLKSSFLSWSEVSLETHQELLKHRLEPMRADPSHQRNLIDNYGLGSVSLPVWSGANIHNCAMAPAPPLSSFEYWVNSQAPDIWKYTFSADEVNSCPNLHETIRQWGRTMHQAGVSHLVTMDPTPALFDDGSGTGRSAVDVWVQLPVQFDRSRTYVEQALNKGDQIWSYNTLVQDPYSPKWMIDFSPMDFRIQPGFINQSLGITGLAYWRVDLWSHDPWNVVDSWGNGNYPGEGQLIYPGNWVGTAAPAPSMRLKWLRDGVEDYEYIQILKNAGQAAAALLTSRTVAVDWTNWTREPAQLQSGRQQLAAQIEQIYGGSGDAVTSANSLSPEPNNPLPAHGTDGVSVLPTISWSPSAGATLYEVYLGESTDPAFQGSTRETSFTIPLLNSATIYFWRILAKTPQGNAVSPTWSFRTN